MGISNFFTAAEAKRIMALLDEERELRFVLLQPQDFAGKQPVARRSHRGVVQVARAKISPYPSRCELAYAELSLADVTAGVQVTDEQLQAAL